MVAFSGRPSLPFLPFQTKSVLLWAVATAGSSDNFPVHRRAPVIQRLGLFPVWKLLPSSTGLDRGDRCFWVWCQDRSGLWNNDAGNLFHRPILRHGRLVSACPGREVRFFLDARSGNWVRHFDVRHHLDGDGLSPYGENLVLVTFVRLKSCAA